jgi:[ribosomal protein S5]-alanine N-acetyltransferase
MVPNRLETPRLVLRPLTWGDAPAIFSSYSQDPLVTKFLVWRPHTQIDDTYAYIAQCVAQPRANGCVYGVMSKTDGAILGAFDLRHPEPHMLYFGYVLARHCWGRGLMTEILTEAADWSMRQPEIWRMSGVCDVENIASARVMLKSGFVQEGILRRYIVHPNISTEPRDCLLFARVRA